ncbi:MAG: hypothetical protein PHV74_03335 [Dehalococcoidia bacterium]|nr:hypothetical protein [Dehalococcoidia bacterium]
MPIHPQSYNGCEFACTYCDSRSHKYHLHPDFDHQIFIKTNIGRMLEARTKELLKTAA